MIMATCPTTCHQFNVRLVKLIQSHPVLYDHTLEGYTNYQAQEKIWRNIADELNEDVPALKLKWKNLRSCYTRYLRHAARGGRNKRSYYLSKHLAFLLPFCKSRWNNLESYENLGIKPPPLNFFEGKVELVEQEEDATSSNSFHNCDDDESQVTEVPLEDPFRNQNGMMDVLENGDIATDQKEQDPDFSFLKSLLPDMKLMDGKQKSKFKIAVLNEIHTTLYE